MVDQDAKDRVLGAAADARVAIEEMEERIAAIEVQEEKFWHRGLPIMSSDPDDFL